MPLARGLALSILEALPPASWGPRPDLHFIDLGVSPASLDWLHERGIRIHTFQRDEYLTLPDAAALPGYTDAQLCRPFLPRLIPGYDSYVWIDADIWIQERDTLQTYLDSLLAAGGNMVICPEFHYGYIPFRDLDSMLRFLSHQIAVLYGEDVAQKSRKRPVLNSGFFALSGTSSLWKDWAEEMQTLFLRTGIPRQSLHLAEQMALNRILYESNRATLLDPVYNYACAASAVTRNARDRVVVGLPPFSPVKAPHLLAFGRYGRMYMEKGLLYQRGAYLDTASRQALLSLCAA
ncbi:hypothetical protein LJC23_03470 [Desulfovibrio sp. OttesenSCG-928-I05]|nr:hypothetical protein [Desulfovibrio sp. OttesenSCG-928-I05]